MPGRSCPFDVGRPTDCQWMPVADAATACRRSDETRPCTESGLASGCSRTDDVLLGVLNMATPADVDAVRGIVSTTACSRSSSRACWSVEVAELNTLLAAS